MGAAVTKRTAAWYPDRVSGVVLTNPPLPVPLARSERMFEGAGHGAPIERPAGYVAAVRDWLTTNDLDGEGRHSD